MQDIKVLIVDDSALYRLIIKSILKKLPNVTVVGSARNGIEAIEKVKSLDIDIVTLDVNMPEMDGIEALQKMKGLKPSLKVIMVSSLSRESADITVDALEHGAFHFITKPDSDDRKKSEEELLSQFKVLIDSVEAPLSATQSVNIKDSGIFEAVKPAVPNSVKHNKFHLMTIGISTGGPKALAAFLPDLPKNFPVPIVVVQHMPALFIHSLAESLNRQCALTVKVAEEGESLKAGFVYLSQGEKHLTVHRNGILKAVYTDGPPVNYCKPAVDVLWNSLAEKDCSNVLALIMTGMGNDGTSGLRNMKLKGAYALGQDRKTCTVYGMPKVASDAGLVDEKFSLENAASAVKSLLGC